MPDREFHPKCYLHYLCDPTLADRRKRYRETAKGVAALRSLDWVRCLGPSPHCPFLHAFLDDLGAGTEQSASLRQLGSCRPASAIPGAEGPDPAEPVRRFRCVELDEGSCEWSR